MHPLTESDYLDSPNSQCDSQDRHKTGAWFPSPCSVLFPLANALLISLSFVFRHSGAQLLGYILASLLHRWWLSTSRLVWAYSHWRYSADLPLCRVVFRYFLGVINHRIGWPATCIKSPAKPSYRGMGANLGEQNHSLWD